MASMVDDSYLLRDLTVRLDSFQNWPVPHIVTPVSLASSGFYYLKEADNAQCAYCKGVIGRWEIGDDPDTEHFRHFPSCPFVQSTIRPRLRFPEVPYTGGNATIDLAHNLEELGINLYEGPKMSDYSTFGSRLRSFSGWPENLIQTPEMLAKAGFYYTGFQDHVLCFSCGGGLSSWEPEDDPWHEHAKWYSKCNYVSLNEEDFKEKITENIRRQSVDFKTGSISAADQENQHSSKTIEELLAEENRILKDARLCKICMDKEANVIFLPCRHLVVCEKCAPSLKTCPICRSSLKATIKTYFS